jgi:hypothetical protein
LLCLGGQGQKQAREGGYKSDHALVHCALR